MKSRSALFLFRAKFETISVKRRKMFLFLVKENISTSEVNLVFHNSVKNHIDVVRQNSFIWIHIFKSPLMRLIKKLGKYKNSY